MRNPVIIAAVLAIASPVLAEPLGFTGSYTNSFDTLPVGPSSASQAGRGPHDLDVGFQVTGFSGWFGSNPSGSASDTQFRAHNGSRAGGDGRGVLSLGTTDSTERALGALSTSNQINTFGLVLRNDSQSAIPTLNVAFAGEQWRRGNIAASVEVPNSLRFSYAVFASDPGPIVIDDLRGTPPPGAPTFTTVDALTFFSPNRQEGTGLTEIALDGNAPENRRSLDAPLSNLDWTPGSYLAIRWSARDIMGQDDGLAIDDLVLSTSIAPPLLKGDFDFDGEVLDSDITGFVSALTGDFAALTALFPTRTVEDFVFIGDFDADGEVLDSDINGFVSALLGGGGRVSAIPEPAALGLLAPLGLLVGRRRR